MAKRKNPKINNPKTNTSNQNTNLNNQNKSKTQKQVDTYIASTSNPSKTPKSARRVNLNFPPLTASELDVIVEEDEQSEEEDLVAAEEPIFVPAAASSSPVLCLSTADVADEVNFWSSAVYCFILGANPKANVISGFVKRVWQSYGVDRISFLANGIFLVRFKTKEKKKEVINTGHLMFDNKPVIVNEWKPEMELIKHEVKSIPIWMKMYGLDIKFWGTGCLSKISGLVGKYLRCDDATNHRAFLGYARILVEVQIGQEFPTEIVFMDELGKVQRIKVVYDWLPVSCEKCKGMGHSANQCRKEPGVKPKRFGGQRPTAVGTPPVQVVTPAPTVSVAVPVTVETSPVFATQSLPRRFISKMLRQDSGEPRIFTPRGLTFMDALTLSMQKVRNGSAGNRLDIQMVTDQSIHSHIIDKSTLKEFWMTMVYGFNRSHERVSLWDSLITYVATVTGPWMVCGDFNSVIEVNERIGGAVVSWSEMAPMREMIVQCQLQGLKTIGSYYTWTNKHEVGSKVYSKLDRVLINEDWLNIFPDSYANFLPEGLYDHCPCLISNYVVEVRKKAPFKYFNMWSLADNYMEVVKYGWQINIHGTHMYQVVKKLRNLKKGLQQLNKESFSDIENLTHVTEISLKHFKEKLRLDPLNESYCEAEHACAEDLKNLMKARNLYLA
ncbi:uncharacterized protein LOC141641045 [Silene latifolia]|uniref:uncharacterized protein LOC141641045 n=1 Tax=Silene latifolia TaxID=37657 RepID=UPI003D76CC79